MDSTESLSFYDIICCFTAKKYCSNHRWFFVLRHFDDSFYRGSVLSVSTRATVVSTESSSSILSTIRRGFRQYRTSTPIRSVDEDVTVPCGPIRPPLVGPNGQAAERLELVCYKSKEEYEAMLPPRQILDLKELLYISDFRQRVDGTTTQFCVSLSAEKFGISFYFDTEREWRNALAHIRNAHVSVAKSAVHRIEYACNVVVRSKGLAKQCDPKLQSVQPGPYRLLLLESKLVFVRESMEKPVLTLYYQWIRQMVRQQRQTLLRRNESLFGLELGHMSDTGEGFIYFRVLDEPTHADSAPGCSGLPRSPLSDMLQTYMKNNSIVRQRRRTQRSNRSRHSTSQSQLSYRTSSSIISGSTSTDYRIGISSGQTMETLCSDFDQASLSTTRSKDLTTGQNSGPSTDETSTPTVTVPASQSVTGSSSATHSSHYLTMDVGDDTRPPASPHHQHRGQATATSSQASWGTGFSESGQNEPVSYINMDAMLPPASVGVTRQQMVSLYMASISTETGDRTQRANSVGSKPVAKESVQSAMPRCGSDILGDSNNSKELRWTSSNAHGTALVQPEPTSPEPALTNPQDLYVDYLPATNFERTASAGACSGLRPTQAPAPSTKTLGFGVDTGRMVGALSLVNTAASTSTRSQLNSCSTSSSAIQLQETPVDDYGVMDFPFLPTNLEGTRDPL